MKRMMFVLGCALLLAATALGQRAWERFTVKFEQPVQVNKDLTLQPGAYVFQQMRTKTNPNVFEIADGNGKHIGSTAIGTDALYRGPGADKRPNNTQIMLKQVGNTYYLDKVFLAGRDKGYQFEVAKGKDLTNAREITVNAEPSTATTASEPR